MSTVHIEIPEPKLEAALALCLTFAFGDLRCLQVEVLEIGSADATSFIGQAAAVVSFRAQYSFFMDYSLSDRLLKWRGCRPEKNIKPLKL